MRKNTRNSRFVLAAVALLFACSGGGGSGPPPGQGGAGGGGSPGTGGAGGGGSPGTGGTPGTGGAGGKLDAGGGGGGGAGGGAPPGRDGGSVDGPPATPPAPLGAGVLTRGYDLRRTGAHLKETILTPPMISQATFGKLYCRPVDDEIYGQILYVPGLDLGAKGKHNTLLVVTNNDSIYAFDADDPNAMPLWQARYANAAMGITAVPKADLGRSFCRPYNDFTSQVGIVSTPALDLASNTLYALARTKEGGRYVQKLHAVNLLDGTDRSSAVVQPATFDAMRQNQRAALLLHDGLVYIAFSSHCDEGPYHGWILGYDAKTLAQTVVWNSTPTGAQGGIWMSGQGPSVDEDGNMYFVSGNGTADVPNGGPNRGQSVIKLRRSGGTLEMLDWFTPFNNRALDNEDRDLGSAGAMLIPGSRLAIVGSKEGKIYVLDRMNLGKYRAGNDGQIIQTVAVTGTLRSHIHGTPVHWKAGDGENVYVFGEEDFLKQYRLVNGRLELFKTSTVKAPVEPARQMINSYTMPGGSMTLSANGDAAASGILWVNMPLSKDANEATVPGILRAFPAADVSTELWNSEQNAARDSFGLYAKHNPPTVYNGRVYQPTFSKQFCVYGKLP